VVGAMLHHAQKRNKTCFSFAQDGRWHCFAHGESERGSIDLTMKVKGIGFQAAVDLLGLGACG
jgi:hypothetical protein